MLIFVVALAVGVALSLTSIKAQSANAPRSSCQAADSLAMIEAFRPQTVRLDTVAIEPAPSKTAFIGLNFYGDLTFDRACERRYPYNYGALVGRVADNSPAQAAGILEDDIITAFGGEQVHYNDHLVRLVDRRQPGEVVPVVLYRDGKIVTTTVTMGRRAEIQPDVEEIIQSLPDDRPRVTITTRRRWPRSTDHGYLSWRHMFFIPDDKALFASLENLGYGTMLSEYELNGELYNGIRLSAFHMVPGDNEDVKFGLIWADGNVTRQRNTASGIRYLEYDISYWGFTWQSDLQIGSRITLSPGLMAGWYTSTLSFYRPVRNFPLDQINTPLTDGNSDHLKIERKYWLLQPNVSLTIALAGPLGVQVNAGYNYGFQRHDGWKVVSNDKSFSLLNSPNTAIGGLVFSIGPTIIMD